MNSEEIILELLVSEDLDKHQLKAKLWARGKRITMNSLEVTLCRMRKAELVGRYRTKLAGYIIRGTRAMWTLDLTKDMGDITKKARVKERDNIILPDFDHALLLKMGYATIIPTSQAVRHDENDAVPAAPAQLHNNAFTFGVSTIYGNP